MTVVFYRRVGGVPAGRRPPSLPAGHALRVWSPGDQGAPPPGSRRPENWIWWAFERLGVFSRPGFVELTLWRGERLAHRMIVTPRWSRFGFMAKSDLQVGDIWTHPDCRGEGLARLTLAIVQALTGPEDRLWYLVESGNTASSRLAQSAGYRVVGQGRRTHRLGLSILGRFELDARKA